MEVKTKHFRKRDAILSCVKETEVQEEVIQMAKNDILE